MRNVMVRCIFSALSVGLCLVGVIGQELRRYQWSDQQVLADEWKPFVPGFTQQRQLETYPVRPETSRQFETYPVRPETSRQFFGKNVEAVQNPFKKSFQTTAPAANNVDPYAVPPILGSFNTLSLQTIQARNPLLEKNIKDNQFLEQGTHLHPKFYPQNNQQPQRFPPSFLPPPPQYIPTQHHHQHQQFPNQFRIENQVKHQQQPQQQQQQQQQHQHPQQQTLLQSPSRAIQTSVQIFPPNPPNHYQNNAYFLGVQQKEESYEDEPLSRKQTLPRPNDFLLNTNNIATIYGTRDPAQSISPPALKPTPFIRNEQIQDHFLYDNANLKSIQRYEGVNGFNRRPFGEPQGIPNKKLNDDNPSKQVYEQLSHFGRPFSLPKEPFNDYNRKPEQHLDIETNQGYNPEIYKKEKLKTSQGPTHQKTAFGRIPPNTIYHEISTPSNQLVDYEPGKLQSIKTVTYVPQRNVIQFSEEDISNNNQQYPTSEKYNAFTKTPFLPTPTEGENEESLGSYNHNFQRFTTTQKPSTSLPKNHKYSSIQHSGNRNRYPQNYASQETTKYVSSTESEKPFEEKIIYSSTTQAPEIENQPQYPEATTRKSGGRRRKPSKGNKTKENRNKIPTYAETPVQNTVNENYVVTNDASTTEATIQYTTKKKPTKYVPSEDDYPNYPQYVKQSDNYPKEFFQNQHLQTSYQRPNTGADYFNSEKEEEKENYPPTLTPISSTTTATPETTTTTIKARIKNKYVNSTRPRFSIKDYKRTTAASTPSTSTTTEVAEETVKTEVKPTRKFNFASRGSKNKTETAKPAEEETTSEGLRKYKPRPRPSKYRTTSTTPATDTTTERVNTFKPATSNRYKSSTSKYYNRFRTTTEITSNDAEEPAPASSEKKPIRTMLFSAKRSSVLKSRSTTTPKVEYVDDDDDENLEDEEELPASSSLKKAISQYKASKIDKVDDTAQTNLMTSSEEQNEKKELKEAAKKNESKDSSNSEEEIDDISDILDLKENEVTTSSGLSAPADDRMDDADKVSKVSSLTSIDESDIPISFFQKWSSNDNQNQ